MALMGAVLPARTALADASIAEVSINTKTITGAHAVSTLSINPRFDELTDDMREDYSLYKRLRSMNVGYIRFPGGEVSDNYNWITNTNYNS